MTFPITPRVQGSDVGILNPAVIENSFFISLLKVLQELPPIYRKLMQIAGPSKGSFETYASLASIPTWRRWRYGESRQVSGIDQFFFNIVNFDWETTIQYHRNTRLDDRSGTVQIQIDQSARNYAILDIDIIVQILEAQVNPEFLPSIPNTYYGIPLLSALHTFVTGGNTINGFGVGNVTQVRDSLYEARERFRGMTQEGNGKPYWSTNEADFQNFKIIIPNDNTKAWDEIVRAEIIPGALAGTSTQTNVLHNRGMEVLSEPRLTNLVDYYVYLDAVPGISPIVKQTRQEPQFFLQTMENSPDAFRTKMEQVGSDARNGYSAYEPRSIVKVLN